MSHADTNFPFSKKESEQRERNRDEKTEGTFRSGNMPHADTNYPFSKMGSEQRERQRDERKET